MTESEVESLTYLAGVSLEDYLQNGNQKAKKAVAKTARKLLLESDPKVTVMNPIAADQMRQVTMLGSNVNRLLRERLVVDGIVNTGEEEKVLRYLKNLIMGILKQPKIITKENKVTQDEK